MSSIGYDRVSVVSGQQQPNIVEQEDDAEFFSVAQEYNERKARMINYRAMEAMNMIHNFNIKNNPKDPKAPQVKQEKTRKTRSDKEGREFTCGACNKSYLSYPALYTHIKTKHNGIMPQGTIRGKNNNNKRRGRPKNLRAQPNLHHRPEPQFTFPKEYCKLVDKYDLTFIQSQELQNAENDQQQLKMDSQIFQEQVRQLKNSNAPIITLPIIKVLAIYLYNVQEFLSNRPDVIQTIQSVSQRLIKLINNNYAKVLTNFQASSNYYIRKEIPDKEIYCNYENCEYIPVLVNWFFKRLDAEVDEIQVNFLSDFCQWLHSKKLTHIKLVKPQVLEAGTTNDNEQ